MLEPILGKLVICTFVKFLVLWAEEVAQRAGVLPDIGRGLIRLSGIACLPSITRHSSVLIPNIAGETLPPSSKPILGPETHYMPAV